MDPRNVQGCCEVVPENFLELSRNKEMSTVEKENLRPGDLERLKSNTNDMILEDNVIKEFEPINCSDMSIGAEYGSPVLADPRGAASKGVAAVVRDMKRRYKVDIVVILEPRISGSQANKVIRSWGFNYSRKVEATGFSGGIWILWELNGLVVDIIRQEEQFLHCKVGLGADKMAFTVVYASPNEHKRGGIWNTLQSIASEMEEPWLLAGDFNEIKSHLEKKGGGRNNETRFAKFNDWIQECNLIDIEASGPFFTWKGPKWEGLDRVYKRLDRCLCNPQWKEVFYNAEVRVILRVCSDHHPLLINLCEEARGNSVRHFKFEAMWLMHDQFETLMKNNWKGEEDVHVKLSLFQQDLIRWNKEVFGRIEARKKRLLNRLNGVQRSIDRRSNVIP
ncbi:hypothetical protein K1719_024062 [Acacia pycnantha]|nr:hypothetical protein K1719_024062 [Acacia pycnantha]